MIRYIYKIAIRFKLKRTTLFLSVFYFDKYLENEKIIREESLFIAAQASMLIAMKYE